MKKILILILIILLGVMCFNTVKDGYQIAGFSVLGLDQIKQKNNELDDAIKEVASKEETSYPAKLSEISSAADDLLSQSKTYSELQKYSTEQQILEASQGERYNIEVLWTKIGGHATENGVVPKLEVMSSSNNTPNANDLKFTVTGNYVAISDFIRDIEEDAKLGFTIEEFELVPAGDGNGTELKATFKAKDIFLNSDSITTTNSSSSSLNTSMQTENINNNVSSKPVNTETSNTINK